LARRGRTRGSLIGASLGADYGPARLRPTPTGGDAFEGDGSFGWSFFAGFGGQAVAHDLTLDGNSFVASRLVSRLPLIGEAVAGFALRFRDAGLTCSHVIETEPFRGQKGGLHQPGSLALSVRF
jgi:lipid A 3-O-deacylase